MKKYKIERNSVQETLLIPLYGRKMAAQMYPDLFVNMAEAFPGAKIVFDATNAKGLKKMLKTWLGSANMTEVGAYFSIEHESEFKKWSNQFESVTRKGYMTGYRPLDKRYGFFANMLFKHVDNARLSNIIEIEFAK